MARTAVATDSNSGITQEQGKELGIFVLPMPFFIKGKLHFEDIDLTQEQFYQMLEDDTPVSTSQPSPGDVTAMWDRLLRTHDEIVFIPMSSGLSSACQTACLLAEDEPYQGRVFVVDNHRISATQAVSVLDAKKLADKGKSGLEIKNILEKEAMDATIFIAVDTLEYLKKG